MSETPPENNLSPGPQVVPHSREAEEAVLGSVLINPESYYDVAQFLQADDFYIHRHRWIWETFQRLHERRTPVDFLTVSEELDELGQLAEVGGPAYLTALINNVPTSLHAEAYGRIVEETAIRRRMLTAANDIAKLAYQEDAGIDTVMDEAEKAVFGVSERRMTRDLQSIQQVLSDYYDRIDQLARRGDEMYGVPTGFIDMDRLLGGLQPSDLLIIAGRPGMGKCVTADTQIADPQSGELFAIQELVRSQKARLLTLSNRYKLESAEATHFIDDGLKPVYGVRTALGREIKVTLSHPFLTIQGWRPLADMAVGDLVAVPRVIPIFGNDELPEHKVKIMAYLLADGNVTGTSPRFTNSNPRLRDEFAAASLRFPGVKVRLTEMDRERTPTVYVVSDLELVKAGRKAFARQLTQTMQRDAWSRKRLAEALGISPALVTLWRAGKCAPSKLAFQKLCDLLDVSGELLARDGLPAMSWKGPNSLRLWLEEVGIWGNTAAEKEVPACVYRLTRQKLALFLNRLFACDGSLYFQGDQAAISYATVSSKLAHAVQHLLLRFGIIAKLRRRQVKYQDSRRSAYELRISDAASILLFIDHIGAFGKEQIVEEMRARIVNKETNPNRAPSRQRLLTIGSALESDLLVDLAESDVYWDKITDIEYLGEQQVYDLTVPDTHNFVANDIIVHNTAFMLSVAKNAAQTYKKHVAIFSLEMSNEQLVQRLISQETGIDSQRLRTGKLSEEEWPVFTHAIEVLSDTRVFLDDTPALTPLQLRTKCRRLHLEYQLDLIIVDYLQLMTSGTRVENRVQEVSYISRNLKVLARELNVPVLAAAQLSRAVEQRADKEPQLSDLRESGSLEQDSDIVLFIHRPEMYEKDTLKQNIAQIKVAKHRNGPVGTVELVFRNNIAKFENAATRHIDLSRVA